MNYGITRANAKEQKSALPLCRLIPIQVVKGALQRAIAGIKFQRSLGDQPRIANALDERPEIPGRAKR